MDGLPLADIIERGSSDFARVTGPGVLSFNMSGATISSITLQEQAKLDVWKRKRLQPRDWIPNWHKTMLRETGCGFMVDLFLCSSAPPPLLLCSLPASPCPLLVLQVYYL